MRRAPTFLVAFCAAIVELVLVAAAGNQWIVNHLVKNESARELPRNRELKSALTAFPWRWTPRSHERMLWLGEVVAVVGLVVVVFLLVIALVGPMRPPRRFLPVFLGVWGVVVGLTQIAAIGRALLAYGNLPKDVDPERLGRFWFSVFDGPTADTVLFGGVSGLIVAIVAGIVAVVTSRGTDKAEPGDELGGPSGTEPDDVPDWSAAIGSTQAIGSTPDIGSTQAIGSTPDVSSTQAIGREADPVASWPPPDPADRVSGWPAPEPPRSEPPRSEPPPTSAPTPGPTSAPPSTPESAAPPWSRPPAERQGSGPDTWSSVTESTTELSRTPDAEPPSPPAPSPASPAPGYEDPTEVTLPRAPQPAPELPLPGSPPTVPLPLPEERRPDVPES
ncbi:MAG TPA: hypothetical protein VE074_11800 [Jatrophihabitantaceae bacterium]|nr:hypothetical protein [Jatrophihabitantaceae bacterium]